MISEWFLSIWVALVEWFSSLLPSDEPPTFLTDVPGFLEDIVESAKGLGPWVPWAYLGGVGAAVLLFWVVLASIKGIRWVWGLTPFSGGS